jgi:hypothetical protein
MEKNSLVLIIFIASAAGLIGGSLSKMFYNNDIAIAQNIVTKK